MNKPIHFNRKPFYAAIVTGAFAISASSVVVADAVNPTAVKYPLIFAATCIPCYPCAGKNPCNPCAAKKNPCNPCNPCAAKKNPCNPCATKKNPCNPCNPCKTSG